MLTAGRVTLSTQRLRAGQFVDAWYRRRPSLDLPPKWFGVRLQGDATRKFRRPHREGPSPGARRADAPVRKRDHRVPHGQNAIDPAARPQRRGLRPTDPGRRRERPRETVTLLPRVGPTLSRLLPARRYGVIVVGGGTCRSRPGRQSLERRGRSRSRPPRPRDHGHLVCSDANDRSVPGTGGSGSSRPLRPGYGARTTFRSSVVVPRVNVAGPPRRQT